MLLLKKDIVTLVANRQFKSFHLLNVTLNIKWKELIDTNLPAVIIPIVMAFIMIAATIIISCQPQSQTELSFSVSLL